MTEPTLEQSKEFYEAWYRHRSDEKNIDQKCRWHAIRQFLRKRGLANARILDIGCGSGWLSCALSAYGPVTAIDLSEEAIAQARRKYPHVRFQAGNFFDAELSGPFDLIVCSEVIEHLSHEDQRRFLQLIADQLAPEGQIILTTPNHPVVAQFGIDEAHGHAHGILQPIENHLTAEQLRGLVESFFQITELRTALFLQPFLRRHRVLNWLRYILYCRLRCLAVIENLFSASLAGTYLCCLAQRTKASKPPVV